MSAFICEPLKDKVLLVDRIFDKKPRRILLVFWHGVGDLVMFLPVYEAIRACFPELQFNIAVPQCLTYRDMVPEALEVTGDEINNDELTSKLPFDLVAKITFPMNEGQDVHTKGEFCMIHEIGTLPGSPSLLQSHGVLGHHQTPLVAVHYQITCLPESCNPDEATAERIWNDVLAAGMVPLECHFQHVFHNPVNTKFPFIDATVRRSQPKLSSLVGLLRHARAFVGVVSGPFHVALSVLGPERVFLLEKDFKREHFTHLDIAHADLRNYQNEVKAFLENLDGN